MSAREIWYHGGLGAVVGVAMTLFWFNLQNPHLTQFEVLREAAEWSWKAWSPSAAGAGAYVVAAFALRKFKASPPSAPRGEEPLS